MNPLSRACLVLQASTRQTCRYVRRSARNLQRVFCQFMLRQGYQGVLSGVSRSTYVGGFPCVPYFRCSRWLLTHYSPTFYFLREQRLGTRYPLHFFFIFGLWPVFSEIGVVEARHPLQDIEAEWEAGTAHVVDRRIFCNVLWLLISAALFFFSPVKALCLLVGLFVISFLENHRQNAGGGVEDIDPQPSRASAVSRRQRTLTHSRSDSRSVRSLGGRIHGFQD